ncbi:MAG: NADH-quinone oxidoreductase subunit C, partial [Blastocatellia bacterium]
MIDLNFVAHQLRATTLAFSELEVRPPRELRVTIKSEDIPAVADYLRDRFGARPELILAEDTRTACGAFTLRYVFELAGADVFIVVSTTVPDGKRCFPSLATRWYLASRFEREILDLFGLFPDDHPDLRRLT